MTIILIKYLWFILALFIGDCSRIKCHVRYARMGYCETEGESTEITVPVYPHFHVNPFLFRPKCWFAFPTIATPHQLTSTACCSKNFSSVCWSIQIVFEERLDKNTVVLAEQQDTKRVLKAAPSLGRQIVFAWSGAKDHSAWKTDDESKPTTCTTNRASNELAAQP